ncbi:hypothetical protein [Halomonas sp. AOP42-D1-22]|uniref:hypothetical protein n=1 Tax=Halomonas sp. AOP42-D1-22 TaxID=3457667 RepID=UPI0040344CF6
MTTSLFPSFHDFLLQPEQLHKGSPPVAPSFRSAVDALVRRYQRGEQQPGVVSFADLAGRRVWVTNQMQALKVPTAQILKNDFSLQHLRDVLEGIDACVIKPKEAHSSKGVLSLKRGGYNVC